MTEAADDPFADAAAYTSEYGVRRQGFLAPPFLASLRLAVFRLPRDARNGLKSRERDLVHVGRDDFAFTIQLRDTLWPLSLVVLQPDVVQVGNAGVAEIETVLRGVLDPHVPSSTERMDVSIPAARYLAASEAHLVDRLVSQMDRAAQAWLASRGRQVVIVARRDAANAFSVQVTDGEVPCDVIVLTAKALSLSQEHSIAVLAHELGHLAYRDEKGAPTPHTTDGEIDADRYAAQWGCRDALREHLAIELSSAASKELRAQLQARVEALK